ncbi:hypothetical protein C8J56DRAFT_1044893 [Mycena floridula]|nr:hypothetical protein C8J56DRAFT_1044893 [Mycena floridula]
MPKSKLKAATPDDSKAKKGRKGSAMAANFEDLRKSAQENLKEHGKAKRTNKAYDGYMTNLRKFIKAVALNERNKEASWQEGGTDRLATEDDGSFDVNKTPSDPEFALAFDGPPKKCTPHAISMFMALKVFEENCGGSTASGIHAAVKRHYKTLDNNKYRGPWNHNYCTGNPADSAEVTDMLEACLNKGNEDERHHSQAMNIRDMEALLTYTEFMLQQAYAAQNMAEVPGFYNDWIHTLDKKL